MDCQPDQEYVEVKVSGEDRPNDVDMIVGEKQQAVLLAVAEYNDTVRAANTLFPVEPPRVCLKVEFDRGYCGHCGRY